MTSKATEIAAKQRHLQLLELVRGGKTLSPKQLRELNEYEAAAAEIRKSENMAKKKKAAKKKKPGKKTAKKKTAAKAKAKRKASVKKTAKPAASAPAAEEMGVADDVCIGQEAAAKYAKVSTRTIRNWVKAGMPTGKGKPTRYRKKDLDEYNTKNPEVDKRRAKLMDAQVRDKEAGASLKELQLKIRNGEYIERGEIDAANLKKIAVTKRVFYQIPRSAAPDLEGLTARQMIPVLTKAIGNALAVLAGPNETTD